MDMKQTTSDGWIETKDIHTILKNPLDYYSDLKNSHTLEKRKKYYSVIMNAFPVKRFRSEELDEKICSNDVVIELENGLKNKIEIKNYDSHNNSNTICLEQYHNHEKKIRGWTHYLIENKTDYVLFYWHGKKKCCYLITYGSKLCLWWCNNSNKYDITINKPTYKDGIYSHTSSFSYVHINDLPQECLYFWERFVDLNDFGGT